MRRSTPSRALLLLLLVVLSLLSLSLADPTTAPTPSVLPRPEARDPREPRAPDARERERMLPPSSGREGRTFPRYPAEGREGVAIHPEDPRMRPADMLGDALTREGVSSRPGMTREQQRAFLTAAIKADTQFTADIGRGPLSSTPSHPPIQCG